jgi:hypothetical protein
MARPLVVDTSRLETAGITLESLVFPSPPPPIAAAGTDTASAAINATMPAIESPVLDGLPAVQAALRSTAANIATAAGIYAQADQTLGENLMRHRFTPSGANTQRSATDRADSSARQAAQSEQSAGDVAAGRQGTGMLAALAGSDEVPAADTAILTPAAQISTQLGQLNGSMGAVNSFTQNVIQSVQGMAKGAPGAGQPGQRPDAVDEDTATDEEQLDEAGAAGGWHASTSAAPVQPLTTASTSTSAPSGAGR